ncbi:hypothetical protein PIB30_080177, partial [Stylosanthes scabra]|nr:hypothetical protein [Stylosanthes scabra]
MDIEDGRSDVVTGCRRYHWVLHEVVAAGALGAVIAASSSGDETARRSFKEEGPPRLARETTGG